MKTFVWWLLFSGLLFAVTPQQKIAEKYGLYLPPKRTLENLDFSTLKLTVDSAVYYYQDTTTMLDSTVGIFGGGVGPKYKKKEVYKHSFSDTGKVERETVYDVDSNKIMVDYKRFFNKKGLLIRTETNSQIFRETYDSFVYDDQGRLVRERLSIKNNDPIVDFKYAYQNKNSIRIEKKINLGYDDSTGFTKFIYTPYDSVIAAIMHRNNELEMPSYIQWFNENHQVKRYVEYFWNHDSSVVKDMYHKYDDKGRLSEAFMFCPPANPTPEQERDHVLYFVRHEAYFYDDRGRLKEKVVRELPFEDS